MKYKGFGRHPRKYLPRCRRKWSFARGISRARRKNTQTWNKAFFGAQAAMLKQECLEERPNNERGVNTDTLIG